MKWGLPLRIVCFHIAYAIPWTLMSQHSQLVAERLIQVSSALALAIFYPTIAIMYIWAHKTALNAILALKHFYWALFVVVIAGPSLLGILLHHAPYGKPINPYSYYQPETWMRSYIWLGMGWTAVLTLVIFFRTNFGRITQLSLCEDTDEVIVASAPVERRSGLDRRWNWGEKKEECIEK